MPKMLTFPGHSWFGKKGTIWLAVHTRAFYILILEKKNFSMWTCDMLFYSVLCSVVLRGERERGRKSKEEKGREMVRT
jgi:hypothetical protein